MKNYFVASWSKQKNGWKLIHGPFSIAKDASDFRLDFYRNRDVFVVVSDGNAAEACDWSGDLIGIRGRIVEFPKESPLLRVAALQSGQIVQTTKALKNKGPGSDRNLAKGMKFKVDWVRGGQVCADPVSPKDEDKGFYFKPDELELVEGKKAAVNLDELEVGPYEDRKGQVILPGDWVSFGLYPKGTAVGQVELSPTAWVVSGGKNYRALRIKTQDGRTYAMPGSTKVLKVKKPMKNITASDRSALIKLASSLPKGDETRRAILAGLEFSKGADPEMVKELKVDANPKSKDQNKPDGWKNL
jgi:hypothetical protein